MQLTRGAAIFIAAAMTLVSAAFAGVPDSLSYQGRLLDAGSQPVTGDYTIIFTLHDAPVGGALLWTEDHVNVPVTDGLFSVELGETVPLTADILAGSGGGGAGGSVYLEVQLAGQPPMSPRTRLLSAPYSVMTGRVMGDITTAPDQVVVGDLDGDGMLDLVSTDEVSELHLARKRPGKVKYSNITLRAAADSVTDYRDTDSDDDGLSDTEYSQRLTPTTSSVAIKTKGTGADPNRVSMVNAEVDDTTASVRNVMDLDGDGIPEIGGSVEVHVERSVLKQFFQTGDVPTEQQRVDTVDADGVRSFSVVDLDGDGALDRVVSSTADATGARLAIGTKGTGAKRLMAGGDCDDTDATLYTDCDDDGDGFVESSFMQNTNAEGTGLSMSALTIDGGMPNRISMNVTVPKLTQRCVISQGSDTDGDGLDETSMSSTVERKSGSIIYLDREGNEVLRSMVGVDSIKGVISTDHDSDDDGVSDSEAMMSVMPGTAYHAIKTKGTGAEANRIVIVSGSVDPSSAVHSSEIDDDGDGVPEQQINQVLTPVRSSVAIKTKGTAADGNRSSIISSTDVTGASSVHSVDLDGDGLADRTISEDCDDSDASIAIDEPGVHIAMRNKGWDGTVKGNLRITDGTNLMVDFDGDGDGYLSHRLGIGVLDPANPIEHSSGAHLTAGGVWTNASDAGLKENFRAVDGRQILEQIERLNISQWNYRNESEEITHIGPTAQDFKEIFNVGADDKTISTIDPSGVALAAIKELSRENRELKSQLMELRTLLEKIMNGK